MVSIPGANSAARVLRKRFSSATTLAESWVSAMA
jgi:hypothetical protein